MLLFYLALTAQLALLCGASWLYYILSNPNIDWTKIRSRAIDILGDFLADVLDHPRLNLALAKVVTNGINHTMQQPDLGPRLHDVSESLREENVKMSRALGEQLPDLAANFVGGAISAIRQKKPKQSNEVTTLKLETLSTVGTESGFPSRLSMRKMKEK